MCKYICVHVQAVLVLHKIKFKILRPLFRILIHILMVNYIISVAIWVNFIIEKYDPGPQNQS